MLLFYIISTLIVSIFLLFLIPKTSKHLIRLIGLISSGFSFYLSVILLSFFNLNHYYFQNIIIYDLNSQFLNLNFSIGIDGLSIFFLVLSNFLIFLCVIFLWDEILLKEYVITLLSINLLLTLVFSTLNLLFFYIFFETILIPMYLLIGVWGSRERKIRAVYLFFFYTLVSSLFMLIGLLYIYSIVGTLNFEFLFQHSFSLEEQYYIWLVFFFSFASKIPLFPLHIWLPEAHVEAPTIGSVLLAGILLKLGVYGFLRFSLVLFPEISLFFSPIVYLLSLLGIIHASLSAIRQTDLKRIIAYSSVAHMNLVTLGIFSFNIIGIEGSLMQSISHGFVSGAMFLLVGILYSRYHSRLFFYYGGLIHMMPLYSVFFLIFTMANIALPGTSSFVGEFLLLAGIYKTSICCCFFATLGVVLCGVYSLWLYNRIIYGNLKVLNTVYFSDINFREFSILLPLLMLTLLMGMYPKVFLNYITFISSSIYLIHL